MYNISIFASGNGTNAQAIIDFFANSTSVCVKLIVCDNPNAYVIERAKNHSIACMLVNKQSFNDKAFMLGLLKDNSIDFIVLAGFLKLVPKFIVEQFENKIVNIHPSLIPLHCGKGMYGDNVHNDVLKCGDKESGITIHFVNQNFDEGAIIFQAKCPVMPDDDAHSLASRIHVLEHEYFPKVIQETITKVLG